MVNNRCFFLHVENFARRKTGEYCEHLWSARSVGWLIIIPTLAKLYINIVWSWRLKWNWVSQECWKLFILLLHSKNDKTNWLKTTFPCVSGIKESNKKKTKYKDTTSISKTATWKLWKTASKCHISTRNEAIKRPVQLCLLCQMSSTSTPACLSQF